MDISLKVAAVTGHYRVAGAVPSMGVARCYPVCPFSTVIGFLESFCGDQPGAFLRSASKVALGWVQRPRGGGTLLRMEQSYGNPQDKRLKDAKTQEGWRPANREMLFDMVYRIDVEGPYADKIRRALAGDVNRYGVLSLGDSDDTVDWICESSREPAEWLVPGNLFPLTVAVNHKPGNVIAPDIRSFDYSKAADEPPSEAWVAPEGPKEKGK